MAFSPAAWSRKVRKILRRIWKAKLKMQNTVNADLHACAALAAMPEETIFCFDDFTKAISMLPWRQEDGNPTYVDRTGNEYIELSENSMSRPCDVDQITRFVLQKAYRRFISDIDDILINRAYRKSGSIHWRARPKLNCFPFAVVTKYCDDGRDFCDLTGRRCVKDKDWVLVKMYARYSFVGGKQ